MGAATFKPLQKAISILLSISLCATIAAVAAPAKAQAYESSSLFEVNQPQAKTYKDVSKVAVSFTAVDPWNKKGIETFVFMKAWCDGKLVLPETMVTGIVQGRYVTINKQVMQLYGKAAPVVKTAKAGTYKFQVICKPYNLRTSKVDTSIPASQYPTKTVTFKVKKTPKVGTILKSTAKNAKFKVTKKAKEVAYVGPINKKKTTYTISATVKIGDYTYKVTSIAANALKGNAKAKSVVIGKNVKTIGKNAFYKCKKLKTITFKGTAVKKINANAFASIQKKATFKVPKAKLKQYKKLLVKKAGFKKTMSIKKV